VQNSPAYGFSVMRWNGSSWTQLGLFSAPARELEAFDDGAGPKLYVSGFVASASVPDPPGLLRWNGLAWSSVSGWFRSVFAMDALDDPQGLGPSLYFGGFSIGASETQASGFARYGRTWPCIESYRTAGTSSNGCAATLSATGNPSASGATPFVVTASALEGRKPGLIFYGLSGAIASAWGTTSSFLCVKAPQQRRTRTDSGGTSGACDGVLALDWNGWHAAHPGALGSPIGAGTTLWLQGWYRDPPSSKTTALTSALEAFVAP
jgi:hypothetical protein